MAYRLPSLLEDKKRAEYYREREIRDLAEQNRLLQTQLRQQQFIMRQREEEQRRRYSGEYAAQAQAAAHYQFVKEERIVVKKNIPSLFETQSREERRTALQRLGGRSDPYPSRKIQYNKPNTTYRPVSEVHYKYKDLTSGFWVYGFEKKVYAPDYPDQCGGCNIL